MTAFAANPFVFIFGGVLLVAMVGYFGWGAFDRIGLPLQSATAAVTGKHFNPPGQTYRTVIAGGRAWTMTDPTAETYVLLLELGDEATVGLADKALFTAVQPGDTVKAQYRRTRLTKRLEVVAVSR